MIFIYVAEPETTTDEYLLKLIKSTQKVVTSESVKSNLVEMAKNAGKSLSEVTTATTTATSGLSNQLTTNDRFSNAVSNLLASIQFLSIIAAATAKNTLTPK